MDTINEKITEVSDSLKKTKPGLLPFFQNSLSYVATHISITPEIVETLHIYSLASEYLYIDIPAIYTIAFARGEFHLLGRLLYSCSALSYRAAATFLSFYKQIQFPLADIADHVLTLVRSCHKQLRPAEKISRVLGFCLSFREKTVCMFFLVHIGSIAKVSPGTVLDVIAIIEKLLTTYPWPHIEQWIVRGTDLLTSNRVDEGVRFLLLRSKQSRWLLDITNVVLDDMKNILKLYCASLAGREMVVAGLDASGFSFTCPYTDGKTIFLPEEIRFFTEPSKNERVFTVFAALQAASIRMKSFQFDLTAIDFDDELHDRYGTLLPEIMANVRKQYADIAKGIKQRPDGEIEVTFKSGRKLLLLNTDHERFFYSFPTPLFARDLFILIENARIACGLSLVYPGLKEDITMVNDFLWAHRPVLFPPGNDRQAAFMAAVECLIQYSLKQEWKGELEDDRLIRQIEKITRAFDRAYNRQNTVQDTARICFDIYTLFFDNFPVVTCLSTNDFSQTFSTLSQPELRSEAVLDVSPELLKQGNGENDRPEEDDEHDREHSIDLTSLRDADGLDKDITTMISRGELKLFRYPEYNTMKGSYEKDHCILLERTLSSAKSDYYRQVVDQYKIEYRKIKKRFLMMKPEEVEVSRRWESGEEIHMTDAFDYMVSLIRRTTPDEKIYFRKMRNVRDIVVAILVDSSSSTLGGLGAGRIIDIEKAALCLLASALSTIEDAFGIFSFFSMGRKRTFFNIIKDFRESWDTSTQARIPGMEGVASNRDGCAIRHATYRLLQEPFRTKLLILLSDGIPADLEYGSTSSSETNVYAIEDTRRAIIEARKQGVIPYCITIDRFAKTYIPHLYGDYGYAIIDDVTLLPGKLTRLYLKLTR